MFVNNKSRHNPSFVVDFLPFLLRGLNVMMRVWFCYCFLIYTLLFSTKELKTKSFFCFYSSRRRIHGSKIVFTFLSLFIRFSHLFVSTQWTQTVVVVVVVEKELSSFYIYFILMIFFLWVHIMLWIKGGEESSEIKLSLFSHQKQ